MNINQEISLTELIAMSKARAVSTSTVSRVEKVSLDDLFNLMKANFSEQNHKFDALSSDINNRFDEQNNKFDDKFNEININLSIL